MFGLETLDKIVHGGKQIRTVFRCQYFLGLPIHRHTIFFSLLGRHFAHHLKNLFLRFLDLLHPLASFDLLAFTLLRFLVGTLRLGTAGGAAGHGISSLLFEVVSVSEIFRTSFISKLDGYFIFLCNDFVSDVSSVPF